MMRGMFLRKLKDFAEQLKTQKITLFERFIRSGNHEEDQQDDDIERSEFIEKIQQTLDLDMVNFIDVGGDNLPQNHYTI